MNLINYALTDIVNLVFCFIIIGYAIKSFMDLKPTKQLSIELKKYIDILNKIKDEKNDSEKIDLEKIYENYESELADQEFEYIGENINDYNKALKRKSFQGVKNEDYFNEICIIDRKFNLIALNQKGPTLVGLGVLGTFVGLYFSLSKINGEAGAMQQMNIINDIIPGMSLAFLTSLLGMITSIIYTRCQKTWIGNSIKKIGQIDYNLNVIFPKNDISEAVSKIEENVKTLSETLTRDLGDSVATAIDKNKDALFGTFAKSMDRNMTNMSQNISKSVSNSLNQIFNHELLEVFKEIQISLVETKNNIENNNEIFLNIVKDLPKVVTRFKTMNDISSSIFENAKNSMQEYDKYMKSTDDFLISMNKMSQLQEQIEKSVNILTETTNKNYETLKNTSENLSDNHKDMNKKLKEDLIELFNKNEKYLGKMNELLMENSKNITSLDKTLGENLKLIAHGMEDRRKDFENQHIKIVESQKRLEGEIGKALNAYDITVSGVTNKIKDIILNMKDMSVEKDK